ncbi:MAG: 4Fe-4S ferredoxin iron-sulfur binding protein [uncultured bacterium]|nr:MAG: 4Fe-4S ferredoxin iron-sulfur binding protein [uncultured bacterium]
MKKVFNLRRISQFIILGVVLFLTIGHMRYGIEKAAPIDAYCPFGAIEGFLTYVTTGQYLQRIYTSSFILMGMLLVLTILFGRVFCSHLCPLGAIQEWVRALGRKIGIKKDIELPRSIDKYARYLKYIILALIVYFSYQTGELIFRGYDPFNALMHLGEEFDEKVVGYLILGILIVVSVFSKNWWCRYFCPFGAGLGIVRKLSPFKIERNADSCISCGKCDEVCPAGLDVANVAEVNSADCISCMGCVKSCPKSSLKATTFGKEISKKNLSLFVMLLFFLSLGTLVLTPFWQTKAPSNIVKSNGELNVSNLRGSNTLEFLLKETRIPFAVFQEKLGLPDNVDKTMKLKDIGPKYELKKADGSFVEMEDFRTVVEEFSK